MIQENTSCLTSESALVGINGNESTQMFKILDGISVTKLKKLHKLLQSDNWESIMQVPNKLSQSYDKNICNQTKQLDKSVGDRVKRK